MTEITKQLAQELHIKISQAEAAVRLIDEGNTIPFIARYRKEVTGSLNDEVLRNLDERLTYLRGLDERKKKVVEAIAEQGKLTMVSLYGVEGTRQKVKEQLEKVRVRYWRRDEAVLVLFP